MEEIPSYAWWEINRATYTDPEWNEEPKHKSSDKT